MHTNAYRNIARQVLLESTLTTVVVSNDDINAVTCRETEREGGKGESKNENRWNGTKCELGEGRGKKKLFRKMMQTKIRFPI